MFDFNIQEAALGAPLEEFEGFDASEYLAKPESAYKTTEEIVQFIENRKSTVNIASDSLRIGGDLIQDSFENYLSSHEYNSSSFLKKALYTPRHYFFEKEFNPQLRKFKNEKHFELGTFIHEAILEPTKFKRVFVQPRLEGVSANSTKHWENFAKCLFDKVKCDNEIVVPDFEEGLKMGEYKDYVDLLIKRSGLDIITEEHYIKIQAFKSVFDSYGGGIIPEILKNSKREVSMYAVDDQTGLKVRIRPDAIQFEENIGVNAIISVKSTRCENLGKFYYDCAKLNYDLSEAMYLDVASQVTGRDFDTVIMIMVQTVEPFGIALIKWTTEDLATGRYKYRYALNNVIEFEETGIKSSYDTYSEEGHRGFIDSRLPEWNKRELYSRNFL